MRREPYTIRPQDIEVRPEAAGIYVTFRSEAPYRPEHAWRFAQAFSRAFDTEVEIGLEDEQRYASIKGLDMTHAARVRTVMNALHIVHTDDSEECPDTCLALDWHMAPESGSPVTSATKIGQLRNLAKQNTPNPKASVTLADKMYAVIQAHHEMSNANYVTYSPSNIAFSNWLAQTLGYWMSIPVLTTEDTREISSQRAASDAGMSFEELCERRKDTIRVRANDLSGSVLIVDDLYRSGGTIREITRQCRALGAECILALPVTKSLTDHHRA